MITRRFNLSEQDQEALVAAIAFLQGRLEQVGTVQWALGLTTRDEAKRSAILDTLHAPTTGPLREPWQSAWRLIEESWAGELEKRDSHIASHLIRRRIQNHERTGALVAEIVALVRPTLKVAKPSRPPFGSGRQVRRPRKVQDLMSLQITSNDLIDPSSLALDDVSERGFLIELCDALDASLASGIHLARRIGWDERRFKWPIGALNRVYFVPPSERASDQHEPDEFHRGIAPVVKLLFAVVVRLLRVGFRVDSIAGRWRDSGTTIHTRLWAALARLPEAAPHISVAEFLSQTNEQEFWNLHLFPEIAELRSRRFSDLVDSSRSKLLVRLRRQPPKSLWPDFVDAETLAEARLFAAAREVQRIRVAGGHLPQDEEDWLLGCLERFPELRQMRLDDGFPGISKARFVPPNPDNRFDLIVGQVRLDALERDLRSQRTGIEDIADRARDWMRQPGRLEQVIADLEEFGSAGGSYVKIWENLGWIHQPLQAASDKSPDAAEKAKSKAEAIRILELLAFLPDQTLSSAIEGISAWLDCWSREIADQSRAAEVWWRVWRFAVQATNAEAIPDNRSFDQSDEGVDIDSLNTPAGKLVGLFLDFCGRFKAQEKPFLISADLCQMRDTIILAPGRSGTVVRHRLIEFLPWFMLADASWTQQHLISPLVSDVGDGIALWNAVARQTRGPKVLEIIGSAMMKRAADSRLGRDTRSSLIASLIFESLNSALEARESAVQGSDIQQMLRLLDEEARAIAAQYVPQYLREVSGTKKRGKLLHTRETIFIKSIRPFLELVWPREKTLTTPGVARAFATLPAACGAEFVSALHVIERYLVPFECWSLLDFDLGLDNDGLMKLTEIDTPEKSEALLVLLDRSIGTSEGAIFPVNLSDALQQIRQVVPRVAEQQSFRRLEALARK